MTSFYGYPSRLKSSVPIWLTNGRQKGRAVGLTAPPRSARAPHASRFSLCQRVLLASLAILFWTGATALYATNFTVNSSSDANTGTGTTGTLRYCITQANLTAGPHVITFTVPSVTFASDYPYLTRQIRIDGGASKVIIQATAGDASIRPFYLLAGSAGSTLINLDIRGGGLEPFRIDGSPANITIRNIVCSNSAGDFWNSALYIYGDAPNLTVRNYLMKNLQNSIAAGIYIAGTATNVVIDSVRMLQGPGGTGIGIRVIGVATTVSITNSYINLDDQATGDDGDNGIYFDSNVTGLTMNNDTLLTCELRALWIGGTSTNISIQNTRVQQLDGYGGAVGLQAVGTVNGFTLNNVLIDMDVTTTLTPAGDDGDYGIYFNGAVANLNLNNVTMHDAEIYSLYVGGAVTGTNSITNSTFDNFDGYGAYEMIRFASSVAGLTMTNVTIDCDQTGTTDDSNDGIGFVGTVSNTTLTNVSVNEADDNGIYIWTNATNLSITGGNLTKNYDGIEFYNCNYSRTNVDLNNITITNSTRFGIVIVTCLGGVNDDVDVTGCMVTNSGASGIYIWNANVATDITVSGCTITGNGKTDVTYNSGVNVNNPDNVVITQNSIYNNTGLGIDHIGNGNCNMEGALAPIINSVTPLGGNMYQVNFSIPVAAGPGTFKVEFFTNNPIAGTEGEFYVSNVSGLSAGLSQTTTITTNTGPAATPKTASLTMTYTRTGAACNGTSEFSNAAALDPQGPACVNAGIVGWYRADKITGATNGQSLTQLLDFSGNSNKFKQTVAAEQPKYFSGDATTNYNPSITFDGAGDNFEILAGVLPTNTGGTILASAYNTNTASTWGDLYNQNIDDPVLHKTSGIQDIGMLDNGNVFYNEPTMKWVNNITATGGLDYGTTASTTHLTFNGRSSANLGGTASPEAGIGYIGGENTGESWTGKIHEMIFYNRPLNATEKQMINSYLSVKWGNSIDTSIMKVAGAGNNYITSDGTVIWTANSTYYKRITGIGRDDCDSLLQKQSRNVDLTSPGYVTMGLGTVAANNAANANTFGADKTFEMWGDDGKSGSSTTTVSGDGTITLVAGTCAQFSRLGKTFKVQETGTVGNVQVIFNMTGIKLGKTAADYYLAINSTSTFAGVITKLIAPTSYDNVTGILIFDNVNFTDGQFFTIIGKRVYGPANITSNLAFWLKAEDGIAATDGNPVDFWGDQGPLGNDATQSVTTKQPTYKAASGLINFNPALDFDGATDNIQLASVLKAATTYTNLNTFVVSLDKVDAGTQNDYFMWQTTTSGRYTAIQSWGNLYSYLESPGGSQFYGNSSPLTKNVADIWQWTDEVGPLGAAIKRSNINIVLNSTVGTSNTGANNPFYIGAANGATNFWNGRLGEAIFYTGALTATEKQKIASYLAVKWGITLNQALPYNYLSADGTVIWNGTINSLYKNRITGIGRDDCSDLVQKQSINQDTLTANVIMGLGTVAATNAANANNFSADKSFEMWGDDGVAGVSSSTITGDGTITLSPNACGIFRRLGKTFKVAETGTVGNVQVQVNLRGLSLGKVATDFYLAINSTSIFTGVITKLVQASSYGGGIVTFNNVNFTDGQFFTIIGQKSQAPANVTANLKLWLKADDGITLNGSTVSGWTDQGSAGNDALQATAAAQPTYNSTTNLINFNPTLSFNGSNYLRTAANIFGTGNINYTAFGIGDHTTVAGNTYYLWDGAAATRQTAAFGRIGASQTQVNYNDDFTAGPIVANIPYLNGYTRDAATNIRTNYQSGKAFIGAATVAMNKTNNGYTEIGASITNTDTWNGKIGEIIAFQSVLTATEQQKVNSYLAVKWGFTLDQTTPYNYLSANGTVIWNATTNATYSSRITGLGREDCSDLQQKQSKSVETGSLVTISNGTTLATTNELNSSSFTADNSWLLFGDNNKGVTWTGTDVPVVGGNVRLNRAWHITETGTVGTVYLEVPDNASALTTKLPAATANIYLIVANSASAGKFSSASGVTSYLMTYDAVNLKWSTTHNFVDGDYFTFGSEKVCIAPVGLSDGLTSWYHATNLAAGAIAPNTANALVDQAFGAYSLNRNASGTATVVAGTASLFNYNNSITLTGNAAFSRAALGLTDIIETSAGSMYGVGTLNTNLFNVSSSAANVSGVNTSALFNNIASGYGAGVATTPNIFGMVGSTAGVTGYTNGTAGSTSAVIAARTGTGYTLGFGQNGSNTSYNNGTIAEAFTYNRLLTTAERFTLESYLAVKYGQTLSHNYFNGDYDGTNAAATTIYDVSTYPNRVFGVGTDTTGCFYQKQSTSALTGSMLKMSITNAFATDNNANTGIFSVDRSYVVAGDDNAAAGAWVVGGGANPNEPIIYAGTCVLPTRIARQWKVTGTYATPSILFAIPDATSTEATKLPTVTAGYSVWMVINDNTDFGVNTSQQELAMTLNATTKNWEASYTVAPGTTHYITFVMKSDAAPTGTTPPVITIAATESSCVADDGNVTSGTSVLLTPTTGASYLWSNAATTATITVAPTMTTTYTVTVTAASGCTGTASFTVTIVPSLAAAIAETDISCLSNDSQVLSGDPATLTASGGATYLWSTGATTAAITVNPTMNTTYMVTVSDGGGCTAIVSASIVIVTAPTVSLVGANSICVGGMTSVSPTSGGTWASSNPAVATITNAGIVTGVSAGTVTFTFTNSISGCSSASTPAVTVNATPVVSIAGASNICVGSTTTLSPSSGGTWVSSNPAVATVVSMGGIVTGVSAGTATFTFTNTATGCVSAPTSAVTVTALPVVSIVGANTICAGSTTTLSPSSGGTWVSSAPAIATVTNGGVVTGVSAGTATFTFTSNVSPNCSATTSAVTVNALTITGIMGASTICVGSTTTLSPSSGGTWVSSNAAIATVTNAGVVTGVSAGSATFTFTSTATGCASMPTPPVTVSALPVVSVTGASSICVGATTALSPTTGGTWTSSAPAVATVTNAGVVTGVSAGSATFTFTDTGSGCTSAPTSAVMVTALPVVSITGASTICAGLTTTLSPTTGGTWVSNTPAVATVTNAGVVTGVSAGTATFTFTATAAPNCSATTTAVTVNATPVVSITGASTICVGSTTALSPTTGGTWVSSAPAVATVTNAGVVTGVSAGSATFTFTMSSTGCVSAPTSAVTVNALPVVSITGLSNICVGTTTTLSPTTGGTWASSNPAVATVTNAGVVTGVSVGTATFTFTNSVTGCASAPTSAVTVNASPTVNITGATNICIGTMSGLSPTSGGTWASSNPAVATVTNAGVVTGVSAGMATFTFTSTATGCTSAPTPAITVNAASVVSVTGSSTICIGTTTTLSPNTGGTWTSSTPMVATVTNAGIVTGVSAGSATFTFTNSTTGCQSAPTSAVTVNALPVASITGTSNICVGTTTTLSPTSGGTWVSSAPAVATVTNAGVVTGVAAGSATFTFTNSITGCVSAPTSAVTVNSSPVVSITGASGICVGATTLLSPTSGGTWTSSAPTIATVTNAGVVTGVSAGSATFTFTNTGTGCVSAPTSAVTVTAIPVVSVTGTSSICIGFTTTLSPTTGGTWVSSAPAVATVTNAGIVTGVSAGTATFTFTNAAGCASAPTSTVTVNAAPVATITGANNICVGSMSGVSPTSGGTWTSSNPGVATVNNAGVVTGVSAGSATFTFTSTATGCVSAATPSITVNSVPSASITGGSTLCIGGTTTLSPTSGGTWASSNALVATVTNAGVVTGVGAGGATFTFTNAAGCASAATSAVTVNAAPTVSITGANTICVGFTTALSPTTGGTWVSSAPAVATVTNAGVVTGVSAGTATFTFTNSVTGCVSAPTSAVTVNAAPVATVVGASTICIGSTTTLSPNSGGTWASSNAAVATVTNAGVVTGVSAGSATFTFTSTATGCASAPTSAVTVNAAPVVLITGASSICVGMTTTLSPTTGGTWTSGNPAVATVTNAGVVTGVSMGTATFTFTNTATGCTSAATSPVTVNALPVVAITGSNNICIGITTTLTPATGGTWTSSNPAVATVTNAGVVTGVTAGTATFTFLSTSTGCSSAPTAAVTVTACSALASVRGFLGGAYDAPTDQMTDALRVAGLIPNAQPYGGAQYTDFGYNGTETIGAGVLSVTGANAIVDWVLVELRNSAAPGTVVTRKAALIQRDGDVVESSTGSTTLTFAGTPAGSYYVVLKHRNHLGVMTSTAIALGSGSPVLVDFTNAAVGNYQLSGATGSTYAQRTLANGKRALWDGNLSNGSGSGNLIQFQGSKSDSDEASFRVLTDMSNVGSDPNYIVIGYERTDGNLDGKVTVQGGGSDADVPFYNVLLFPDNQITNAPNYIIYQQIP